MWNSCSVDLLPQMCQTDRPILNDSDRANQANVSIPVNPRPKKKKLPIHVEFSPKVQLSQVYPKRIHSHIYFACFESTQQNGRIVSLAISYPPVSVPFENHAQSFIS